MARNVTPCDLFGVPLHHVRNEYGDLIGPAALSYRGAMIVAADFRDKHPNGPECGVVSNKTGRYVSEVWGHRP